MSRLDEIKARQKQPFDAMYDSDKAWLLSEVERLAAANERLQEKNDRQVVYGQAALNVAERVTALTAENARYKTADSIVRDFAAFYKPHVRALRCCQTVDQDGRPNDTGGYHGKECPWMRAMDYAAAGVVVSEREPT